MNLHPTYRPSSLLEILRRNISTNYRLAIFASCISRCKLRRFSKKLPMSSDNVDTTTPSRNFPISNRSFPYKPTSEKLLLQQHQYSETSKIFLLESCRIIQR